MSRIAIVASHPIQYQAPWFRALAAHVDVRVWFCHRQTPADQAAAGFDREFDWDVPLLDGYESAWLTNRSPAPGVRTFGGCDTPEIADRLGEGGFAACIVNGWYLKSYVQAIRACWKLGIPVLVRGDSHLREPRRRVVTAAKFLPYRWFLRRIDAHLYVGGANRSYLEHYGVRPEQLFFAPHFVDNDRFAAGAAAARASGEAGAIRARWGADGRACLFLFAGKLLERKRPFDFLAAIEQASAQDPTIRGVFVGSGPLEDALRAEAASRRLPVHFAGFHNQQAMPGCYAAADCLVLPSFAGESWGLVVNEGMACGLPAIVSDRVGCAPDLIEPGVTGFVCAPGAAATLAAQMIDVARRPAEERARWTAAVLRRISAYSCAAAVAGTCAAIAAVIAAPARSAAAAVR